VYKSGIDMANPGPGPRSTGTLLIASAVVVTAAFAGLGSAFDYPAILGRPADQVLAEFGARSWLVGGLFALLALGAAMLAPIALGTARMAGPGRWSTAAAVTGVAAALVQLVGLARWPLLAPSLAATVTDPATSPVDRAGAVEQFTWLNTVLGQGAGRSGRLPAHGRLDGAGPARPPATPRASPGLRRGRAGVP
jgi:hypothetical protein